MRIAVAYDEAEVFQHFGHTEQFKIYELTDGRITGKKIVDTDGSGHGALVGFLKEQGVDALICGGIGMGAKNALQEAGIALYGGVSGKADSAVEAFLEGKLTYQTNASCNHHHEEGHHDCGEHGEQHSCGHGSCGQ